MNKLIYWFASVAIATRLAYDGGVAYAQKPSTVIRVLDATRVAGIAGVVLLVNPGDDRKTQAFVTDSQGEAIARDLSCEICTVSAFDPSGLFASRTTEFSGSSASVSLAMQLRPLIDSVGDPKAASIELVINDANGEPLVQRDVVIRPTAVTLGDNRLSVQRTGPAGHVDVQLRSGDYTVGALDGDAVSEARFEIATVREGCSGDIGTCVVIPPGSSRRSKATILRLSTGSLNMPQHDGGHANDAKQR